MNQLRRLYDNLSIRQRATVGLSLVAVLGLLYAIAAWSKDRNFKPLFSNLAAEDAGLIATRLRERGADFRLAENGATVEVPSEIVAELRLELAAAGLPKSGRIGFELFDKASIGTTEFAEQVNYHRALEGELERSVMAIAEVESARVHLSMAKDSLFAESRQPAKASVMVKLRPGAKLAPQSVAAISHLAASAVEGLEPQAVSVIDMRGNLLNRARKAQATEGAADEASIEYRQHLERDLLRKIDATLEPLVGPEKYRAGLSLDVDYSSGEQSEETFDPSKSVMASEQRTEDVSGSGGAGGVSGGVPGIASSLPRPTSTPGTTTGGRNVARKTETVTYQSSRMIRKVKLPQGGIKRMSLAVLIDHGVRWEGAGAGARRVVEPPTPEKLAKIKDLVAAAVGLQPTRGDQLIVETLPFDATVNGDTVAARPVAPPVSTGFRLPFDAKYLTWAGAAVVVLALVGGFWVLRPVKPRTAAKATPAQIPSEPAPAMAPVPDFQRTLEERLQDKLQKKQQIEAEAVEALSLGPAAGTRGEVLVKHITEEAKRDPATVVQILRNWLQEDTTRV